MANNSKEEPRTAPQPDRWYNLTLGPSYHHSSNKFCTLRYEFKPASIDKGKPGKLQKTKENRVSVEFQNNQIGKPKVAFEGSTEDYKDNDAVLFFDGETFRLERLHRAVKQLRHVRQPGESAAAAQSLDPDPVLSPPVGRGAKPMHMPTITTFNPVPVEVERIDIGEPQTTGAKPSDKRVVDQFFESPRRSPASVAASPEQKNDDTEENHDIDVDELFEGAISDYEDDNNNNNNEEKNDNPEPDNNDGMNLSRQNESDEEIADVDDSGDEGKGQNAADALRAQLNAEAGNEKQQSSSSSSSSGSESGSGSSSSSSSSSSSGSEAASDDDSVNSV